MLQIKYICVGVIGNPQYSQQQTQYQQSSGQQQTFNQQQYQSQQGYSSQGQGYGKNTNALTTLNTYITARIKTGCRSRFSNEECENDVWTDFTFIQGFFNVCFGLDFKQGFFFFMFALVSSCCPEVMWPLRKDTGSS